ncbi:MAG: YbhN family protein [Actinobacteria bacterium]|nr:YbhN family protein [Actinomycetota bacterium]MCL6105668.1 YbhN family protein [Actinomycetota bacterium]
MSDNNHPDEGNQNSDLSSRGPNSAHPSGPPSGPKPAEGGDQADPHRLSTPAEHIPLSPLRRFLHLLISPLRHGITLFVIVLVVEYIVLPELAGAKGTLSLLGKVNVIYLIFGILSEAAALVAYTQLTHVVLSRNSPSRSTLFRINTSALAVSHILPGGTAPGTAVGYRLLVENNVTGSDAGFILATQGIGSAVVLNVLFWAALVVSIPLHGFNPLYWIAALVTAILMAAFAGLVLLLTKGQEHAEKWLLSITDRIPLLKKKLAHDLVHRMADRVDALLSNKSILRRAIVWAVANWLLDGASLWIFLAAFGKFVSPINLLVAYGLANILAAIPVTPGGLGIVEGILITTLIGFATPKGVAILGVLTYRLFNFWLPIPLGGICYLSLKLEPYKKSKNS